MAANQLKQETDLFGASRNLPKEFTYELLLNEVTMYWNEASSSSGRPQNRDWIVEIQPVKSLC